MSRYKSKKFILDEEEGKQTPPPTQGKSFLEVLLNESTGEDFPDEIEENFAEIAIPDRNKKKKHLKFLRFPKLKEMLDNLSPVKPEKTDGYVIMEEESSLSTKELENANHEALKHDDTDEFLFNIEAKLKQFANIGRNRSGKSEDEDDFEEGIVKSITQDNNIISETLADLLMSQGQTLKAFKMYEALILKFPEKSIYFAKKIKALK